MRMALELLYKPTDMKNQSTHQHVWDSGGKNVTRSHALESEKEAELKYEKAIMNRFPVMKPIEIQLKLVSSDQEVPRNIKSVTLTLSSLEEAWHIFEDLTNLAWEKIIQK